MAKSMTGYGRAQEILDNYEISVEIKTVNHRYFEFSSRIPRNFGYLEEKFKSYIQKQISRGKTDVNVTVYTVNTDDTKVEINTELAQNYINALRQANCQLGLKDDFTLNSITRFSDIFTIKQEPHDEDEVWQRVKQVAQTAIDSCIKMREKEGEALKLDIEQKLSEILNNVSLIETRFPQMVEEYRNKLYAKMCEILADSKIDEQRILLESAVYSEKIAIDEELVRLKSHVNHFRELLNQQEPIGRKLDFLVQELNRETNTIGSKAYDIQITKIVVEIKSVIEKIREQIQNIE